MLRRQMDFGIFYQKYNRNPLFFVIQFLKINKVYLKIFREALLRIKNLIGCIPTMHKKNDRV